jgi:serine/threonine protein kinase
MPLPSSVPPDPTSHPEREVGSGLSRLGMALASPLGILLTLPALVSLVGTFLTLLGEHALRGSNLAVAQERTLEQARLVASSVRDALEQAEPVLDRLDDLARQHGPERPFEPFAHALLDLMNARAGVSYVSVSFPDGTFQGAYVDNDGATRVQDSRVHPDGTHVKRYAYSERGQLRLMREDRTSYDPRIRGFYMLATRDEKRVWTEPYLFYDSRTAGITRAGPVYLESGGARRLHAVTTIDFDVLALSSYLRRRQPSGMRALLYTDDGTILAYAGDPALPLSSTTERPLRFQELNDPLLTSFFAGSQGARRAEARVESLSLGEVRYFAAIAPITIDPRLTWSMAFLVPEHHFMRELEAYEDRSLWIGGLAVLVSTLLAYMFARHITRVREEAEVARAEARAARALAREARAEARELGSYRLVACLGRGGMGEVWRAQHRLLAREAAIKLIKSDALSASEQGMRERFRREAEALAKLRSRNTIELFDYGVADDGTFFLVMELLDGLDFESLVQRHGPQPPARVVHLLAQVCNSLSEAHGAGLVHRDIKPANLFVCRAAEEVDVVKVLDFGLVRAAMDSGEEQEGPLLHQVLLSRLTHAEGMVGTPAFMSPEQVHRQAIDGRADLYALGGVAYFLLTGKLVFHAESPMDLLLAHLHEPIPNLRERLLPEVPDALVDIITACLAKDPSERPASAADLRRSLRAVAFSTEQLWSEEYAARWWAEHRAQPTLHPPAPEPRALQVGPTLSMTKR